LSTKKFKKFKFSYAQSGLDFFDAIINNRLSPVAIRVIGKLKTVCLYVWDFARAPQALAPRVAPSF
jgi:hypothetical protein